MKKSATKQNAAVVFLLLLGLLARGVAGSRRPTTTIMFHPSSSSSGVCNSIVCDFLASLSSCSPFPLNLGYSGYYIPTFYFLNSSYFRHSFDTFVGHDFLTEVSEYSSVIVYGFSIFYSRVNVICRCDLSDDH